jgi:hypothetical protein
MRLSLAVCTVLALAALVGTPRAFAQGYNPNPGHLEPVVEAAAEFGGDNLVKVFFRDGSTQDIKAGQGVTVSAGAHYQPPGFPIDFAATAGYKFVRTRAFDSDLGVNRIVLKVTGTYALPNRFWVDAGPVWHTATKLDGDGYLPDVSFDDAVGVTFGAGWRWIGVTYTHITYKSSLTGSVDGSNAGVTFTWKF